MCMFILYCENVTLRKAKFRNIAKFRNVTKSLLNLELLLKPGLKDPWGAPTSTEPLPSYDSIVKPAPTVDPWTVGGAPLAATGTTLDPWGSGGTTTSAATSLPQPVPTAE